MLWVPSLGTFRDLVDVLNRAKIYVNQSTVSGLQVRGQTRGFTIQENIVALYDNGTRKRAAMQYIILKKIVCHILYHI